LWKLLPFLWHETLKNTQLIPPLKASGPLAALNPVFRFVGSSTFRKKFFTLVSFGGLLLLYAYFGS
jgi:hypothetical protein